MRFAPAQLEPLKSFVVALCITRYNIKKLHIVLIQWIYVFYVDLQKNRQTNKQTKKQANKRTSVCTHTHTHIRMSMQTVTFALHRINLLVLYNLGGGCLLRGTYWVCIGTSKFRS